MEQIILYLQLFAVATLIVIVIYRIGGAFMNLLWQNEMEQLGRVVLFRSFNWFRFALPLSILVIIVYPIRELLSGNGIFPAIGWVLIAAATTVSYFLYKRISSDRELSRYHKYNTSTHFYQTLSLSEKLTVYDTMISRLKNSDFHNQALSRELQSTIDNGFIPLLDSILTFEWFDRELCGSQSNYTVGRLFVSNFRRDILSLLRAIQVKITGSPASNLDYSEFVHTLLKAQFLRFDDRKGVHYDETRILNRIDEILLKQSKSLNATNYTPAESNRNVGHEPANASTDLLESTHTYEPKTDKSEEMDPPSREEFLALKHVTDQFRRKLTAPIELENCTRDDCANYIIHHLQIKQGVRINKHNIADIRKLFKDHFVHKGARKYTTNTGPYQQPSFFGKNKKHIYHAFSDLATKYDNIEKKKIAEMLVHALPEQFKNAGTIQSQMSK